MYDMIKRRQKTEKRLQDLLDEIKARENAVKVVVLLGEVGVGKEIVFSASFLLRYSQ